jgi:GT2 family glycosyltransferase/tetratricopeptide (TPR) repeat protein
LPIGLKMGLSGKDENIQINSVQAPARPYLLGPVPPPLGREARPRPPDTWLCLRFDATGRGEFLLGPGDDWPAVRARLPAGWQPDFVALKLPQAPVPPALWPAPVPIVALAPDWDRYWHLYRRLLPGCDLVLTDPAGVGALAGAGIHHAVAAPPAGGGVLGEEQLRLIEAQWPALGERARRRVAAGQPPADLLTRTWHALAGDAGDPALAGDLAAALVHQPGSATLHNALGLIVSRGAPDEPAAHRQAAGYFERALAADPGHVLAGLNRAEALARGAREAEAIRQARRTLAVLELWSPNLDPAVRDAGHYPARFDLFRREWERAAWANAGRPDAEDRAKRDLLRWRLHTLLADLTGDLPHYYEAALARPDLPVSRAALGGALARAGQAAQAVPHLRQAVAQDPFDLDAARALFQALGQAGDGLGQRRLADERRLLARAAPQKVPLEPWMERVPPPGDELASLVILCCNELEFTRRCLESVLRHTRPPYELVLVDNGSSDGTPAYLEGVRAAAGPARVVVLRNDANRGFAAGVNQGLARAGGRYVVLLNNDTVVTPGWLDGLVGWTLHDWPHVGLVGPVSNYAPPPQHAPAGYADLAGLDAFAQQRRREFAGKAVGVERLTGFCLLLRREVLQAVGALDEGYGVGFFEDDDLCVRAREAGFGLLAAQDVYVHHFGSRTFAGLGIDPRPQLQANLERFTAKWGAERAAGYRLADLAPGAGPAGEPIPEAEAKAVPAGRQRVSLCLIVKNEEANLPGCLLSAADLVDEVVVVDTGSTDQTKAVAQQFGARVFDFPWVDDFAAARNETLRHATGDWIFWLDADDRIDEPNRQKLRGLFAALGDETAAYAMKCRCLPDPHSGTATVVDHVRLFRHRPEVRWQYRVHEQILPAVRRAGGAVRATDITIEHTGYVDPALRGRKQERDLRLLRRDEAEHPDDPFILFNLGWTLEEAGQPAEALPYLRRSLELSHPGDSIVRKLSTLVVECHRRLGQPEEALAACREGRQHYPEDAQMLFQEGILRKEQGDAAGAEACLVRLAQGGEGPHFASAAEGLRGHLARHHLGLLYREQGRLAEAEAQWRAALAEEPGFTPSRLGLGELYLGQGRWPELEEILGQLEAAGGVRELVGAAVLRARGQLARREYPAARGLLEEALSRAPREAALWEVLSHALLQEGRDWGAAEHALRQVLELEPANAEARRNLAVLLRQQGQALGRSAG